MDQRGNAIDHREYEELLAAAALGALTPEEHAMLKHHMRGCTACRQEFGWLLSVADALPLVVEERQPSAELREWLRVEVEQDARARRWQPNPTTPADAPVPLPVDPHRPPSQRTLTGWPMWIAAAAAVLVIGLLGGVALDRWVLDGDESEPTREIALQFPTDLDVERAELTYLPEDELLRFSAPDLPAPPAGQVYQVWLIGRQEQPPTPVGTIDAETGAFAVAADTERYGTFAVTVEPGPLGSPQPTSDLVIVAELGDDPAS